LQHLARKLNQALRDIAQSCAIDVLGEGEQSIAQHKGTDRWVQSQGFRCASEVT
jgi:hypothetical protein